MNWMENFPFLQLVNCSSNWRKKNLQRARKKIRISFSISILCVLPPFLCFKAFSRRRHLFVILCRHLSAHSTCIRFNVWANKKYFFCSLSIFFFFALNLSCISETKSSSFLPFLELKTKMQSYNKCNAKSSDRTEQSEMHSFAFVRLSNRNSLNPIDAQNKRKRRICSQTV